MVEEVFSGPRIIYIVTEAEAINEWNSVKFEYEGVEIDASKLKLIVQNDPDQG